MVILISICCVECVHIASGVVVHHIMSFLKIDTMRTLDCALVGLDIALAEDSKEVNKIRTHKKELSLSLRFQFASEWRFCFGFRLYVSRSISSLSVCHYIYLLQFIKVCVGMVARGIINKHKNCLYWLLAGSQTEYFMSFDLDKPIKTLVEKATPH